MEMTTGSSPFRPILDIMFWSKTELAMVDFQIFQCYKIRILKVNYLRKKLFICDCNSGKFKKTFCGTDLYLNLQLTS